jgi:hypothetical protein
VAFELIGPSRRATIDLHDELLFDIAALAGVRGPAIERLWKEFYDAPRFEARHARTMADEFKALLGAMRANPALVRDAWKARPEAFRRDYPLPVPETFEAKCVEIIAVCEEGARSGQRLRSLSD